MPSTIDRYLFGQVAARLVVITSLILAILSLENVGRLSADLVRTDAPLALLARLMAVLVPEHLAAAVPIAIFLAVALTARSLSMRGEWQMLAASGLSPRRVMAAPMVAALLAALMLLADRLELLPWGERRLDAIYGEVRSGLHGVPLPVGEAVPLDAATTLFARDSVPGEPSMLADVLIRRGTQVMSAARSSVAGDVSGAVAITLHRGVAIHPASDGSLRSVTFDHLVVHGRPAMLGLVPGDQRHRLDRLGAADLWRAAARRGDAAAALGARVEGPLFCLLLPFLGVAFGVPAHRRPGGAVLLLGILLIALHLKTSNVVEERFAAYPVSAGIVHWLAWAMLVAVCGSWAERRRGAVVDRSALVLWRTGLGDSRRFADRIAGLTLRKRQRLRRPSRAGAQPGFY